MFLISSGMVNVGTFGLFYIDLYLNVELPRSVKYFVIIDFRILDMSLFSPKNFIYNIRVSKGLDK